MKQGDRVTLRSKKDSYMNGTLIDNIKGNSARVLWDRHEEPVTENVNKLKITDHKPTMKLFC